MKLFIWLACFALVAACGALPVRVKRGHEHEHHHEHATSYQNFNLESYHPVPVYAKHHEHAEPLLKSAAYEHLSSDGELGAVGAHLGSSLGEHEQHESQAGLAEGYASLGHSLLGEGSAYHRAALTDVADQGNDAYHGGSVVAQAEDADEGYEGHGSY